ncbi:hypothetical protein Tco_0017165 [Tanacetum coccineum]
MASHRSNPLRYQEFSTCEGLYTKRFFVRDSAFLRKKFDEDLLAYCVENGIFQDFQNTSESSDDNTNVVNALREPCVVNQDPGVKSSQDPPQIDHNCMGAHYGYNCPPKDLIISKPEPCNQTINEIPKTLPSLDLSCYSLPHVLKPNFVDNSPNFSYPPPQLQFKTYLCELCGNNAHNGYDCSPQLPFVYEQEPCYNQNFNDNYFLQNSLSFSQQYLCCAYCGGPHYDYQCQPINETYCEPNSNYDSSGFDQPQPPQDSVDHQGILQILNKMEEKFEEIIRDQRKKKEDMGIEEMMHEQQLVDREIKEIINDLGYKRFRGEKIDEEYERDFVTAILVTCDDEDDYIPLAITTDLPIEEPDNSLNMGDEHLDTILTTESDEVIKSSVENLVPIPSDLQERPYFSEEFAGELGTYAPIPAGILIGLIPELNSFLFEIEPDQEGLISIDNSNNTLLELPEFESFHFDPSFPRPPPEPPDVEILEPENNNFDVLNNDESFDPREGENVVFLNVEEDDSFTFTIRTFLPFVTYPEASPLSCSTGSEDTIFDPGIST